MAEDVEKNTNEDNIDNSEAAKLYERLFNSFQEYLKNGGHAYVLDDSGYFDQFGFDAGDRKHAEELNSYANRKAMESVKKAGHQKTQEVIFAEDALLRIKYFEKWDSQRLRDSGVYDQKDDAWKTYRWDNEEQRTKDIEIERQRREAEWQKREAEAEKQRIEAERQRIEMENKEKTKSNNNAAEENSRGQNMNTEEKKTEPKTENMENPKTEVKDFDFEKFLAQLSQENPNMSIIKAGIEKFGTGNLSDAQKTQFLKAMFPEGNKYVSLGFENMQGICNVLAAVEDLSRNGKLQSDQVKNILQVESPYNGMNMVSTLALNIRAGEFKLPHMSDTNDSKIITDNLERSQLALEFLGQLDKDVVKEVINTPDNSAKKFSLAKLAESGNSEMLSAFMADNNYNQFAAENSNENNQENTTVIGGNDSLTIDGVQQQQPMNVNTPKPAAKAPEEDDDENVANFYTNEGKDGKKKKHPFDIQIGKEQDIIQFMLEKWLYPLLTYAAMSPIWLSNKLLDAFENRYETGIPKAPIKKDEIEKNKKAIEFLNSGSDIADGFIKNLKNQKAAYDVIAMSGPQAIARHHPMLVGVADNPLFADNLNTLKNLTETEFDYISKCLKIGSGLAVATYMAQNPNGPFDKEAQDKVAKLAVDKTHDFMEKINLINERVEYNYRLENNLAPDTKLTDEQREEVTKRSTGVLKTFADGFTKHGKDLRESINSYHQRMPKSSKQSKEDIMATEFAAMEAFLSDEHLNELCPSELKKSKGNSVSLYDFTKQSVESSVIQQNWKDYLTNNNRVLDAAIDSNNSRKGIRKRLTKMRNSVIPNKFNFFGRS